jgi:hypothetical protein
MVEPAAEDGMRERSLFHDVDMRGYRGEEV